MKYSIFIILLFLLFIVLSGCSSGSKSASNPFMPWVDNDTGDNRQPGDIPDFDLPESGHAIMLTGTFEVDMKKLEIHDVPNQLDPFYMNIHHNLADYFRKTIVNVNPPWVTINLEIENPVAIPFYEMRIIFVDLFGKEIENPEGYTNFYTRKWDPGYSPFNYLPGAGFNPYFNFARDYEKHAFPAGPGTRESVTLDLYWPIGAESNVTYIIECSVDENTDEPYQINDLTQDGNITTTGGAAILSCEIEDANDEIGVVTLQMENLFPKSAEMLRFGDTNTFWTNCINLYSLTPGKYPVLIKAEPKDRSNVSSWCYATVDVESSATKAPRFAGMPYHMETGFHKGKAQYETSFSANLNDESLNTYSYLWEQLLPLEPRGEFIDSSGWASSPNPQYESWLNPNIMNGEDYLLKLTVKTSDKSKKSKVMFPYSTREQTPPEITHPIDFQPSPIKGGQMGIFNVEAIDPYVLPDILNFHFLYEWKQTSPDFPCGYFPDNAVPIVHWYAPVVEEDTTFTFEVKITKYWLDPQLSTTGTVKVLVLK